MAQVDYFLKLDGIPGESVDSKHKDEIDIMSFSFGETQTGTASGGGAGAGKVQMQDFHFTMRTSTASPKLFLACANGEHIKDGILVGRRAGEKPLEFFKWKFIDCLISSYQVGGSSGDAVPTDQIGLTFGKIEFSCTPQKADGTAGAEEKAGWDVKANKKL